jgi:NADH-quinone oxidoreductase subunit H
MGGLRSAAQMISYELPLVLALVGVVMLTSVLGNNGIGTISIKDIMTFQSSDLWPFKGIGFFDFIFQGFTPWAWFILVQPLMLLIYYTCGLAETNRSPFDLPEAESELVAGYVTEYSGMRWAMFYLGEYGNMTIVSAIATLLFLGGWSGPGVAYLTGLGSLGWGFLGNILALIYFILKVYLLCFVFIWVRSTLPRLRADQLMQFTWLLLIPITLGNILLTGIVYLILNGLGLPNLVFLIVLGIINWILFFGFVQVVQGATANTTRHAQAPSIYARQRASTAPQLAERASAGVASGQK